MRLVFEESETGKRKQGGYRLVSTGSTKVVLEIKSCRNVKNRDQNSASKEVHSLKLHGDKFDRQDHPRASQP